MAGSLPPSHLPIKDSPLQDYDTSVRDATSGTKAGGQMRDSREGQASSQSQQSLGWGSAQGYSWRREWVFRFTCQKRQSSGTHPRSPWEGALIKAATKKAEQQSQAQGLYTKHPWSLLHACKRCFIHQTITKVPPSAEPGWTGTTKHESTFMILFKDSRSQ